MLFFSLNQISFEVLILRASWKIFIFKGGVFFGHGRKLQLIYIYLYSGFLKESEIVVIFLWCESVVLLRREGGKGGGGLEGGIDSIFVVV